MSAVAAIEVNELVKRYPRVTALDGVSLRVEQGEFFGLLGPNGAGRTTLISTVAGLARASSGRVTVLGHDGVREYREGKPMTHPEPFGGERDPLLAAALREQLDLTQHGAFVARVMARVQPRVSAWEELARWARPGIAAAIITLAMLSAWGALQLETESAPTDVAETAELEPLDSDGLIGVALGTTR